MAQKGKVEIDRERCKGCYLCLRACPLKLLEADTAPNTSGTYPALARTNDKCVACGSCYMVCPDAAIEVYVLEGGAQ